MRTLLLAGLVAVLTVWAAAPARADVLSVSADVPVSFAFDDDTLKDPSANGVILGLALPGFAGLGYESYKVNGNLNSAISPFEYTVNMVDLFLDLPFPAANLVLGAGVGKGTFDVPSSALTYEDAGLTQVYFSLGIPFGLLFDVHVGYSSISGDANVSDGSTLNLKSQLATVGLKIGF